MELYELITILARATTYQICYCEYDLIWLHEQLVITDKRTWNCIRMQMKRKPKQALTRTQVVDITRIQLSLTPRVHCLSVSILELYARASFDGWPFNDSWRFLFISMMWKATCWVLLINNSENQEYPRQMGIFRNKSSIKVDTMYSYRLSWEWY